MTAIIQAEKLTKYYGSHLGIVDVDLEVQQGEVFGFLGPNGAGKTTTIRTILDLIRPTSGRALVFGIESTVDPVAIHRRIGWRLRRSWIFVLSGLLIPVLALAGYNIARFGSPLDFGYAHIPSGDESLLITDEPWFTEGLMSISYIPRHLEVMFLRFFDIVAEPPSLRPNITGASLLLTAPFIFWSLLARGRLVVILWLSVILVILPDLTWGTWGFAQFGYRRILDVMPLLLLLLAIAFRERIGWFPKATILFGAAVHAYAIFVWNVLDFVA